MSDTKAIPVEAAAGAWSKAAGLLEQAVRAGNRDSQTAYLLAMCYKRLGRPGEARAALARIAEPDANVHLQRGLLAYGEKEFGQAEIDFGRSWEMAPSSYAAGYNLLLARLCQKKREDSTGLIEKLVPLAPDSGEQRFLSLLRILLLTGSGAALAKEVQTAVSAMSGDDEKRLVDMLAGLGQFEVILPLLQFLVQLRPQSAFAHQAHFRAILAQSKDLMDRNLWNEAYVLLASLTKPSDLQVEKVDCYWRIALFNMLGTCSCMLQDFERGVWFFRSAQETFKREQTSPQGKARQYNGQGIFQEAWLEQNLALAYEWMGKLDKAEAHWNRYFDYLEYNLDKSKPADYLHNLAFEGLNRLAELFTRKEKWQTALGFLQRAHKIKPTDPDVLERLFHLYDQLRKPEEARKILRRLREMKPNDPTVELFELDVREVRDIDDLERFLADLRRLMQKHTSNLQVEERAATLIANVFPFMERLFDQWTTQVSRVLDQMRRLPSYQINWPVVREVMRDLEDRFLQLRKAASRTQSLARGDVRRDLQRLVSHCDRKIEQCHSLGE